jgi:hypothetical protein
LKGSGFRTLVLLESEGDLARLSGQIPKEKL